MSPSNAQKTAKRPRVLIVSGPYVNRRLDLIRSMSGDFEFIAAGSDPSLAGVFKAAGVPYHSYRLARKAAPWADFLTVIELRNLIRREQPSIVHAFGTKPTVLARLAAPSAQSPVIVGTITGLGHLYTNNRTMTRLVRAIYELLQRIACKRSDLTIFQNEENRSEWVRRRMISKERTTVISGSGIRTDVFDPAKVPASERPKVRRELGIPNETLLVTMIGRLIRSKGATHFAHMAQSLYRQSTGLEFLIVGGPDTDHPDALSDSEIREVAQNVRLAGPRTDITSLLAASDIFVLPSSYPEGVPRVLLEAAAMELPIVTTRMPGCREAVQDGVSGHLVPVGDADSLVSAVKALADSTRLREKFGRAGRQHMISRFQLSQVCDLTKQAYLRLLAKKASGCGAL